MTFSEKITQLVDMIHSTLPQLIGRKCVLLDVPYYENIGDVLIWEGTECFLKQNKIKCIYRASKDTYEASKVPRGVTILLQGGGNFGDLWRQHQEFRLKVIQNHPDNKIIILPQTVYYERDEVMNKEALIMAKHSDLTICARDLLSEKLLKRYFSNPVVTLPDMAFCIPYDDLARYVLPVTSDRSLFVKRRDKELSNIDYHLYFVKEVEEHDWPSYERVSKQMTRYSILVHYRSCLSSVGCAWLPDYYANHYLRPHYVQMGVNFLSEYNYIYTTRLHVAILSTLLHKPYTFFDNSYGKNSSFFNTWLNDIDEIKFISA